MNVFADTLSQKRLQLLVYRPKEKFFYNIGNLLDALYRYLSRQKILYDIIDSEDCRGFSINLYGKFATLSDCVLYVISASIYEKLRKIFRYECRS
jgi:hypothetical protein